MMNWCAIGTSLPTSASTPFSGTVSLHFTDANGGGRLPDKLPLSVEIGRRMNITTTTTTTRNSRKSSITMRDRSKNRKPLQRGRNLSIEAIQTVQALKRAAKNKSSESTLLEGVLASNFKRLLKFDMVAVLRELLRQNECLLALKVFEEVQKEYWYKPQVSLYAEIISVLGSNGLYERIDTLFMELKMETSLEPDTKGFNALLENLMTFNMTGHAMECFYLMKSLGCEPDKSSFRILINGLESKGETDLSTIVRQEAEKYYGKLALNFLEEYEELIGS